MPNDDENTQRCKVFTAQTSKLENGKVAIKEVVLKNVPTPLFVLFAYGGHGAIELEKAARNKQLRLRKKYPDAEIRIIEGFLYPNEFKQEWTKLYNELTSPETSCQYALWQIHYFGHGGHDALYLQGKGNNIHFNDQDNMEVLPWHPNEGIFVLHSCRGGAYEDTCDKDMIEQQICLAKTISEKQKTRCLGQVTYGNFAADIGTFNQDIIVGIGGIIVAASETTTAEQDAEVFKYRPDRVSNKAILPFASCALWGYALVTGDTLEKTLLRKKDYEEKLLKQGVINPIYPIYEEIKKLAPKKQILPCRVFNNGTLEPRIVEIDVFNQNDLEYI
ncbi:hypothetical protein A9G35_04140 [Gilliamella sp. Choc5-1]|uniref:hypothetical protein n=1 Tax=Gilliamella sp. Choc5-1 TaxID=3120238 RepID=UPI00080DECD3|nr:hypothetical protein [Gilliamella apicola]OCG47149.1 hypothetical protein A9G35_04140 [Gilliamella apicola]